MENVEYVCTFFVISHPKVHTYSMFSRFRIRIRAPDTGRVTPGAGGTYSDAKTWKTLNAYAFLISRPNMHGSGMPKTLNMYAFYVASPPLPGRDAHGTDTEHGTRRNTEFAAAPLQRRTRRLNLSGFLIGGGWGPPTRRAADPPTPLSPHNNNKK